MPTQAKQKKGGGRTIIYPEEGKVAYSSRGGRFDGTLCFFFSLALENFGIPLGRGKRKREFSSRFQLINKQTLTHTSHRFCWPARGEAPKST